jgi:beta-glucanase (GH16 family)
MILRNGAVSHLVPAVYVRACTADWIDMRKRTLITSAIVSVALCACGAPSTLASKSHNNLSAKELPASSNGAAGSTSASTAAQSGAASSAARTGVAATSSAAGRGVKKPTASSASSDAQVAHLQATKAATAAAAAAASTAATSRAAAAAIAATTATSAPAPAKTTATPAKTTTTKAPAVAAVAASTWRTVFADNFDGSSLSSSWWDYNGKSSASNSYFKPANVKVSGGSLILTSTKATGAWTGAGVGQKTNLKYGRWLVRGRMDKGHGTTFVALLWPLVGWPPEIDFAEDNAGDRNMMLGTVHYVGGSQVSKTLSGIDSTQWHTYGVEWTPGKVVFTVDGRIWGTTAASNTPSQTMRLGLQTEPWTTGTNFFHAIDSSTPSSVHMYIDSVTIQAYS